MPPIDSSEEIPSRPDPSSSMPTAGRCWGIYAGEDARINGGVPRLEVELMAQQNDYKFVGYTGAGHPFFNNTGSQYSINQNPPKRPVWKPWIGSKTT